MIDNSAPFAGASLDLAVVPNAPPTGSVSITGNAVQGQTLTATNTLADSNGLGTIVYQWLADGIAIAGATGSTLTLGSATSGKAITVVASYTDGGGFHEAVGSAPTATVVPLNTAAAFGHSGPGTVIDGAPSVGYANKVVMQADGKMVITGRITESGVNSFFVQRFNADGSIDASFNGGQIATIPAPGSSNVNGLGIDAQGRIVIDGFYAKSGSLSEFVAARFTPTGQLDTTFGTTGVVTTIIDVRSDQARAMLLQADGKVIAAGSTTAGTPSVNRDFALVRYNTDGSLDSTFSGDGIAVTSLGTTSDVISSLAALPGGQFFALGSQANTSTLAVNVVLAKYNSDGSLDTTFATGGLATVSLRDSHNTLPTTGMLVEPGGKVVVIGSEDRGLGDSSTAPFMLRFNANGTLDASFGTNGKVSTPFGNFIDQISKVIEQADGKILVCGLSFYTGSTNHGVIARYNTDGSLDTSFGDHGLVYSPFPTPSDDGFQDIALQSDGRIVATGFRTPASLGTTDVTLVRYNANGTVDTTFNGATSLGVSVPYTENGAPVALDSHASVYDAQLSAVGSYEGATLTLHRHGAASTEDIFSTQGAVSLAAGNVVVGGTNVGTYTNGGGTLAIAFGAGSSESIVDTILSSLAYSNASDLPASSVTIDWLFNDGNTGAQGAGGARATSGSTTVAITRVNDAPTGSVAIHGVAVVGQELTADVGIQDADGLGTFSYQWMRAGVPISLATGSAYTVVGADTGKVLSVEVKYVDGGGTHETVDSSGTAPVVTGILPVGQSRVVVGGSGNDVLVSGHGPFFMAGGAGNDTYIVTSDRTTIQESPGGGTDLVVSSVSFLLPNNVENLLLVGHRNTDARGNAMANELTGNDANNTLRGDAGADTLTGGLGADHFVFGSVGDSPAVRGAWDVITDFSAAEGDVIDLSRIDANVAVRGNQTFHFIGGAAFSQVDATGQVRFDAATHMLYASVNADANAEFALQLLGVTALSAGDIIL